MTTVHKNLTGADLHEPKGADTALSGQVYVSNGAGSGVWTTASSIITNTAFTTGDLKQTHKTTADTSWIMWVDGTIGDGSSGASVRANADTAALFALYWNNYSNTLCPILTSSGSVTTRGASAAADFAAHCRLTLPLGTGRVLGIAGLGNGLTNRVLGTGYGVETIALGTANLPAYTPSGSITASITSATGGGNTMWGWTGSGSTAVQSQSSSLVIPSSSMNPINGGVVSATFIGTAQGGSSTPFSIMQPSAFVNVMIKL